MPGSMDFSFSTPGTQPQAARRVPSETFRILVAGDFSGRSGRAAHEASPAIRDRRTPSVDVDTFDRVLGSVKPEIHLEGFGIEEPGIRLSITDLEDFHPDQLYDRLDLFRSLQASRERLMHEGSFAEEARKWAGHAAPGAPSKPDPGEPAAEGESESQTLERLLGERPAAPEANRQARAAAGIDDFLKRLVAPHLVPGPDPRRDDLVASVDLATSELMRRVLHHPHFQQAEAAWRSLWELVTNLETGEEIRVHLLDLSREELISDLAANLADLTGSALHHHLVDQAGGSRGTEPWSVVVADFTFGDDPGDAGILAALGAIASRAGTPVLAGAAPALAGVPDWPGAPDPRQWTSLEGEAADNWRALRESPLARHLGLALPRILLRLPYGERTDAITRFAFEEMPESRLHETYLWGNPAFACARLLGESFSSGGASMEPGDHLDIGDLPSHVVEVDGEKVQQACAEAYLSDRAGDALLDRGLIPLLSLRHHNAVRVLRFQSLADPPAPLAGPWR